MRFSLRWPLVAIMALGATSCGGSSEKQTVTSTSHAKAATHTVRGTVDVFTGYGCGEAGSAGGLSAGTEVIVTNQAHAIVATTSLETGASGELNNYDCLLPFVATVPDASFYTFTIKQLSTTKSKTELDSAGWSVKITAKSG